ncbi:hypothetical protein AGMMS50212_15290 [Spirochaetia bacterium]|nr:hypothetical protein AGMMS50212_15290 [Spirochaetia bacterium]
MKKVIIFALLLSGGMLMAQEDAEDSSSTETTEQTEAVSSHRHNPFDMLVGIGFGVGGFGQGDVTALKKGNLIVAATFGANYDFYLTSWFSLNSGFFFKPQVSAVLKEDVDKNDPNNLTKDFSDVIRSPLLLTIPFQFHINIPKVEWLYAGAGVSLNIPVAAMIPKGTLNGIDTKGDFFVSVPIDLGFDFIKPDSGGGRFFFRFEPSFINSSTVLTPIGFIWQFYNWRVYHKN